jgi:hypothetical protein
MKDKNPYNNKWRHQLRTALGALMLIFVFIVCVGSKCHRSADSTAKNRSDKTSQTHTGPAAETAAMNYDSLFAVVRPIQDSIYTNSLGPATIAHLLAAAFDTFSGSYFVVGKGIKNKKLPENVGLEGQTMASSYDGKRWALYCQAWHLDTKIKFGQKISGEILYSKTVFNRQEGDTLFALVQVPIGSIVLK